MIASGTEKLWTRYIPYLHNSVTITYFDSSAREKVEQTLNAYDTHDSVIRRKIIQLFKPNLWWSIYVVDDDVDTL